MDKNQEKLNHTAEHILHRAMELLYPGLKRVMGPPIENGFYHDFDYDGKVSEDDFSKIEAKMKEIIDANLPIVMKEVSVEEVQKLFKDNEYKLEFLEEFVGEDKDITVSIMGKEDDEFYEVDLCKGPHVKSTGKIKAFKLLSVAGAYWRGDEKNKMLQRIYGTAFDSQKKLDEHLQEMEERQKYDHRNLNKVMDIFATSDLVGKGLVMYTPNGTIIRNELRDHLMQVSKKHGAKEVNIPHLAKLELYQKSGHAEKFKGEFFKVIGHYDNEYVLKPMNCPHHTQIYTSRPRSYRDLPIAYVESTQQHRDEKPGSMVGLNRTVSFEIDDGHTFCTPEQVKEETMKLVKVIEEFYEVFGMWGEHWVSLSFRDPKHPEKYIGDEKDWDKAQQILMEINKEMNLNGKIMEGEAALYGPKIDIMYKDAQGNDRQLGTIQIDFAMPQRLGLEYTDKDGQKKTPVMIHRAILGSYHRFIAYVLESRRGNLPVWLAPVQAVVIPIGETHVEYAQKIAQMLKEKHIRTEIDDSDNTMQNKIRQAQELKVPYMLIVGDREVENNQISVRLRDGENTGAKDLEEVVDKINEIRLTKSLQLW
ncbi:threonine--tRNA ligase [bacterium]|nr:threonine--tRNA ligase [bacterium]